MPDSPKSEKEDPRRAKVLTDSDAPKTAISSTLRDEPKVKA
jgi:hypothetical protein